MHAKILLEESDTESLAEVEDEDEEHVLGWPRRRSWIECEPLDRATDLWIDRVLFRERRKEVMRRWRDGRHEEWWRKNIEARVFWNWVRADRQMTKHGYGVRARAERAISFEQLAWRETVWKEMEGRKEMEMEMEGRKRKRLWGESRRWAGTAMR